MRSQNGSTRLVRDDDGVEKDGYDINELRLEKAVGPSPTRKEKEAATNVRLLHQMKKEENKFFALRPYWDHCIGIREQFQIQKTLATPSLEREMVLSR